MSFKQQIDAVKLEAVNLDTSKYQCVYETIQSIILQKVKENPYIHEFYINTAELIPRDDTYGNYAKYIREQFDKENITYDFDEYGGITIEL